MIRTYLDCPYHRIVVQFLAANPVKAIKVDRCGFKDNVIFNPAGSGLSRGGIFFPKTCRSRCKNKDCPMGFPL